MGAKRSSVLWLIFWLALCFAAARINAIFPPGEWFDSLTKPSWMPPRELIGPIWIVLYVLMAISAWLVWRKKNVRGAYIAIAIFSIQLLFNAAWSWLFFGMRLKGVAFVEISILWVLILVTIRAFWNYSRAASVLLIPYLIWVAVAAALNLSLWRLNT